MMERFSVIIPFLGEGSEIGRTFEYLEKQVYPEECVQIIIVNGTPEQDGEVISEFEQNHSETVLVVNSETDVTLNDALNMGLQYCDGSFVCFVKPGDALHPILFRTIDELLQMTDADLISFKTTRVMDEFEAFGDDPFSLDDAEVYQLGNDKKRIEYLNNPLLRENFLGYAYNVELLRESQHIFTSETNDEESTYVFPLLLVASVVVDIPDHGYFVFGYDEDLNESTVTARIADNKNAQVALLEELRGYPAIFEEFSELIMAHFVRRFYLHSIELARASGYDDAISLEQFDIMRFVCLKLIPKWIDNDCIYGFNPYEMKFLKLLNNGPESEEELRKLLYDDAKVSVIITTYNRSEVLLRTIKNVLNQTYRRIELLVVDDGSTDGTDKAIGEVYDERLRYIRNEKNQGVSVVRNQGIENATGRYIMYHDDDDHSRLDKIEKQIMFIQLLPEDYGAVYHETMIHKKDGDVFLSDIIPKRLMNDVRKRDNIFPALLPKNFVTCPSLFIKRECFDEIGIFDINLAVYEDWDITLRLAKRYKIGFDKEPLYDYYLSSTGLISNKAEEHRVKVVKALYEIDLRYEEDRKEYGIDSQIKVVDKK